ncbi:MAG: SnoaL-like domain protein [Bryobacterales bacterium]|nr:SnoaL-like domain protein [Bryobacterales bacterium]
MRLLIAALFLLASALAANRPTEFFAQLDRDWADATVHGDLAKLDRLLSDDMTYTHSGGATDTKQQFLDGLRSGKRKYESIEFREVNVRQYGNAAIVTSRPQVHVISDGHDTRFSPRFLHVWVKQNGSWRLAAHQSTNVAE